MKKESENFPQNLENWVKITLEKKIPKISQFFQEK